MAQGSIPWGGTTVGDAGPYSADQWAEVWSAVFTSDATEEGVIPVNGLELACSYPGGNIVRVGAGRAIVAGRFYANTADVDLAIAFPGSGSNFYTVVLRADITAQTVRLDILGPDVSSPPAVTQNVTTFEIEIYTVEAQSGMSCIITDKRVYCQTMKAPNFLFYQGGLENNLGSAPGTTSWPLGTSVVQVGYVQGIIDAALQSKVITLSYPRTFDNVPMILVSCNDANTEAATDKGCIVTAIPKTGNEMAQASILIGRPEGEATTDPHTVNVFWMAIGDMK